jgi:hypothetical protein
MAPASIAGQRAVKPALRRDRAAATPSAIGNALSTVAMRAETQRIVDEIKQSVGLLRRHL